ncbi:MAG: amidohydrolase [Sphingomonadaceae bacterium]|nr:amidohydrolase [Sphingomonadaceae bacterium]
MKHFVFSADSHVMEPRTLFLDALPASLKGHAMQARKVDDFIVTGTDHKVIYKLRVGFNDEKKLGDNERLGIRDLGGRLIDMEKDGIDAEICFPSLGLWLYCLDDPEAEAASCRIYNDWNDGFLGGHLDRFVRCGMLPVQDFSNTRQELQYLASKGFTAAMLPAVMPKALPKYNDPRWDEIFALAGELGIVFVLHTGTGLETVQGERGPGAAVINYSSQATDAIGSCMYLVAGGVLDRNPKAKVAFIESGASWLAAIGERMDEVFEAHHDFVRPALGRKPSEIINDQIWASFQHDKSCILSRRIAPNIMFASDYPHSEGTFPHTRTAIERLFADVDISDADRAAILGGNAANLFRLRNPALASAAA